MISRNTASTNIASIVVLQLPAKRIVKRIRVVAADHRASNEAKLSVLTGISQRGGVEGIRGSYG